MTLARALRRDERGTTLVEFALILTPLLVAIMGLIELGYSAYVQSLLQAALQTAARESALGTKSAADIRADVDRTMGPVIRSSYITTTVQSYFNYSGVGKDEKLTAGTDRNANGKYDAGIKPNAECFEDANDNGVFDTAASAGRGNTGGPDDIVAYTVSVRFPRILPTSRLLGFSSDGSLSGTTMMRNQPFARNSVIRSICR